MAERKVSCPKCKGTDELSIVTDIRVRVDIDSFGNQTNGAEFGAEGHRRWIVCGWCGHSWPTKRHFNLTIDVR